MNQINKYSIVLFFSIINTGCTMFQSETKTKSIIEKILTKNFVFYSDDSIDFNEWALYEIFEDKMYCPKDWVRVDKENVNLYLSISNTDKYNFFIFNRYNKSKDLTINFYVKEIIKAIEKDKSEEVIEFIVLKLIYENRIFYSIEAKSKIQNNEYVFCEILWYENNFLYDIGAKFESTNSEKGLLNYRTILHNTLINGVPLFRLDHPVQKVELVTDLDSIE